MEDNSDQNKNKDDKPRFPFDDNKFGLLILVGVVVAVLVFFYLFNNSTGQTSMSFTDFLDSVDNGSITEVEIVDGSTLRGRSIDGSGNTIVTSKIPLTSSVVLDRLLESGVPISSANSAPSIGRILAQFFPWLIMGVIIYALFRTMNSGSKAFSFGKSKAKSYDKSQGIVTFADVAGHKEAKYELSEVVDFLKSPQRFLDIGARIPRGVLLVGRPGTGKTLLARGVAGEASVSFFHMSGSDFVEMFVGVGASRVRDLFEQGRKNAPCILFIDEIDAVGRTRGAGLGGGNDEREQTLNQLLVEMDGFGAQEGVILMAATNRPDVLDPALLRPGRFDRQVVVDLPDVREREAILKIHARKIKVGDQVDFRALARRSAGTSGADLANIINEAALFAARAKRATVIMEDMEEARDKVLMGVARKSMVMTDSEKRLTAYHEAGHTIISYFTTHKIPMEKVTIIPRGRALGVTQMSVEDMHAPLKSFLLDRIKISLGGYVSEELIYKETTVGTSNDLKSATDIARRMVSEWGMSKTVGPVSYSDEEPVFIGREFSSHKSYAESTASLIDSEVNKIVNDCLAETREIIKNHANELDELASALMEKETLFDDDVRKILQLPPSQSENDTEEQDENGAEKEAE